MTWVGRGREAVALRQMLIIRLGARCGGCGVVDGQLDVDHVLGRGWDRPAREYDSYSRVRRYWREFLSGVALRVLCRTCNGRDGARFA